MARAAASARNLFRSPCHTDTQTAGQLSLTDRRIHLFNRAAKVARGMLRHDGLLAGQGCTPLEVEAGDCFFCLLPRGTPVSPFDD